MTDYMICQNQDNHLLYALKHDRFWFWDKHQNKWVPSDWAAQQYAKAQTKEPDLAQEDWLGRCFGILKDDYEVPDAVVKALRALSNKEGPPCKVNTTAPNADAAVTMAAPAATLAEETSTTQADANSCPPDPCSPADASGAMSNLSGAAAACSAAEFDYSGLDAQTVTDLHLAEQTYTSGRKLAEMGLRRMADGVSIAHDALCGGVVHKMDNSKHGNRGEDTFRRWCESIGVGKSTAYKLLQVAALFDSSSPRQQQVLEELSPSLLYAAAKPSAPENEDSALRRATEAEQRAKEAEKQLADARQVADAARMRADKYQREAEAAKAQPVAAAVDEDEINRRAHTLADELTAPLRSELEAAKAAAATPEQIELDTRNAYDSLLLAGRAMQNAWKSVKPQLAKLPPDTRAGAINQLTSTLTEIQTEAIKCL